MYKNKKSQTIRNCFSISNRVTGVGAQDTFPSKHSCGGPERTTPKEMSGNLKLVILRKPKLRHGFERPAFSRKRFSSGKNP